MSKIDLATRCENQDHWLAKITQVRTYDGTGGVPTDCNTALTTQVLISSVAATFPATNTSTGVSALSVTDANVTVAATAAFVRGYDGGGVCRGQWASEVTFSPSTTVNGSGGAPATLAYLITQTASDGA